MTTVEITRVSRWFGNVVAVNDVTMRIGPGVTGMLGPNGAGKSTILNMIAGFLSPSSGSVSIDGQPTWHNTEIYRTIGLVPEREALYDGFSGYAFVLANAKLHKLPNAKDATRRAIETVQMTSAMDRNVSTYSKGMKQRIKMATALLHDPKVLLLDEPFNGMDPQQRLQLMELLRQMGEEGRTVLFSSHILEEVEQLASRIEVMVSGRHAASGDFREIRRLMTNRPHEYIVRSSNDRALAAAIISDYSISGIEIETESRPNPYGTRLDNPAGVRVHCTDIDRLAKALPMLAKQLDIRLYEVVPKDESLESVFSYLVAR